MRIIDALIAEVKQEARTTRAFLEAIPADQLDYRPHEKSMSLGQLAAHVASIPGHMATWAMTDTFSYNPEAGGSKPSPTKEQILADFGSHLTDCLAKLDTVDDAKAQGMWTFEMGGKAMMTMPRCEFYRYWMLNHLYHHRGQLGVYLRLTGARVPSSYGPSGDENPMAGAAG